MSTPEIVFAAVACLWVTLSVMFLPYLAMVWALDIDDPHDAHVVKKVIMAVWAIPSVLVGLALSGYINVQFTIPWVRVLFANAN